MITRETFRRRRKESRNSGNIERVRVREKTNAEEEVIGDVLAENGVKL